MRILLAIILSTIISNPALPVITGPSVQTELYQIQHFKNQILIGDHVNQELVRLNEVTSGATATIYLSDNTYTNLHCIDAGPGNNNGLYLTDQYGNDWNYWTCDFAVYTCISGSASGVYITKWNYG